ncbi:MAG: hypothetical protein K9L22_02345 [Methylococcaceae bacterium]|nr:hypothetical protein [Methylococcaceae bacterium]
MKISTPAIIFLFISPVYAEMYKCTENGQISYQDKQCKINGSAFIPSKDISTEQQQSAREKLKSDLAIRNEEKKQAKEAQDKERLIQAQEDKANAAYRNARASEEQAKQSARQADALEKSNTSNHYTRPYYVINPKPIVKPRPTPFLRK